MGGKRFSEITVALEADDRRKASLFTANFLDDADSTTARAGIARAIAASKIQIDVEVTFSGFGHVGLLADALSAYGLRHNLIVRTLPNDITHQISPSNRHRINIVRIHHATDTSALITKLDAASSTQVILVPDPGISVASELEKYHVLDAADAAGLSIQHWVDDRQLGDDLPMLTTLAVATLARSVITVIRTRLEISGRPVCKMVLTDLDNTLWGGVVGEDGIGNLEMGKTGDVDHAHYQRLLKTLQSQGALLVAVSRNRPEDVAQAFANRTDMALTEDDFLTIDASWEPKAQTISRILSSAQIAPNAAIFIDDDPLERRQVANAFPDLLVPDDGHQPDRALARLVAGGLFADSLTKEDEARTLSTRAAMDLAQNLQSTNDRSKILKSLGIQISMEPLDEANLPRARQLADRVTQFRTASTPDHWDTPDRNVFLAKLRETGMDHGRIGLVIWRQSGSSAILELLCLSCRALNRDIESVLIGETIRQARSAGLIHIEGSVEQLPRNEPARDLFLNHGFAEISPSLFRRELHDIPTPDHIVIDAKGPTNP